MPKTDIVELTELNIKTPKKYCAVIHNDDTTSFDFVIYILNSVYNKSIEESVQLAMLTHETGSAVVMKGFKSYLETLSNEALREANAHGYVEFTITNEPE